MATLRITAAEFGPRIREQLRRDTETLRAAALEACAWGERQAVRKTTAAGLVDRGWFKSMWHHAQITGGAELRNAAPHASTIEHGRRPGRPGPPLQPIIDWVNRKMRRTFRAEYRIVRSLALSQAGNRRAASRAFSGGRTAGEIVDAKVYIVAKAIRDKIHLRGTKPHLILYSTFTLMKPRFRAEVVRRLRRRQVR